MPWELRTGGTETAPAGTGGSAFTYRGGEGMMLDRQGGAPAGGAGAGARLVKTRVIGALLE
jgi:hypothetical protein